MAKPEVLIDVNPIVVTPSVYRVVIKGNDSILFNRMPLMDKPKSESKNASKQDPTAQEWETWREKLYVDHKGLCFIPGEGQKTYTDVIASSVIVEALSLGIGKDDPSILPDGRMCNGNPSKGKKSGAKVFKIRPLLRPWGGEFRMHVFDNRLSPAILKAVLTYAGSFKGLCDWRPKFGRFELVSLTKEEF
jgi:hypothetical protein